jgi:predicted transglutaminase-like protease
MAYFGVDKQVRIDEINLTLKNIIRNKGGIGLRNLKTVFSQFDRNGNGKLD